MPLPKPIDRHSREERIFGRGEPIGEAFDSAVAEIGLGRGEGPARLYWLVLFGPIGLAAREDVARLLLSRPVDFHGPERRQGGATASPSTTARAIHGRELLFQILHFFARILRQRLPDLD